MTLGDRFLIILYNSAVTNNGITQGEMEGLIAYIAQETTADAANFTVGEQR